MIASYNVSSSCVPLSLSIGFATMSTSYSGVGEVIGLGDYNMYQEKNEPARIKYMLT